MKQWFLGFLCVCLAGSVQAGTSIAVGAMYDYMPSDSSSFLKRIRNVGDATAFVKLEIFEILYDAAGKSAEHPLAQLTGRPAALVASPARLIIPAQGTQSARFLHMGSRDVERYYRLRFIPVVPEKPGEFGLSTEEEDQYKKSLNATIAVMTGYGTVMIVRPAQVTYKTETQDLPDRFTVHNAGNSFVLLDDFYDCDGAARKNCKTPVVHHLRPNMVHTFKKSPGRYYSFVLVEGNKQRKLSFQSAS